MLREVWAVMAPRPGPAYEVGSRRCAHYKCKFGTRVKSARRMNCGPSAAVTWSPSPRSWSQCYVTYGKPAHRPQHRFYALLTLP